MNKVFKCIRARCAGFARQDTGAATVDWVLLCSGATVMGFIALDMGQQSMGSYSATLRNEVQAPYFETSWTSTLNIPPQENWPDQPAITPVPDLDQDNGVLDDVFEVLNPAAIPSCETTDATCAVPPATDTTEPVPPGVTAPATPPAPPAPPAPVTVVNGDFATNDGSGWTFSGSGMLIVYYNVLGFNAGNSEPGGTASQTVTTQSGQAYVLSVEAGENGSTVGTHTLVTEIIDATGTVIATRTDVIMDASSQTLTLPFVATSAQTTLRFHNPTSSATYITDVIIDNVTVTPI
jgi:hypothetical protein